MGVVVFHAYDSSQTLIDRGPRDPDEEPPVSDISHDAELGDLAPQEEYDA